MGHLPLSQKRLDHSVGAIQEWITECPQLQEADSKDYSMQWRNLFTTLSFINKVKCELKCQVIPVYLCGDHRWQVYHSTWLLYCWVCVPFSPSALNYTRLHCTLLTISLLVLH